MHQVGTSSLLKYVRMGEGKESLKFGGGEEIKQCTECTYLGTKIDQWGDNTQEIKHRINQTRKAINALNSIWWHKNITKNRKLYEGWNFNSGNYLFTTDTK